MAIKQHPTKIIIDSPARKQSLNVPTQPVSTAPEIQLWYGDITQPGAIGSEDILAVSLAGSSTLIGSPTINNWLNTIWATSPRTKWFGLDPCLNGEVYSGGSSIGHVIDWQPSFGPLTTAQAAPYKTDNIFRTAQAMWGHIPKSILIPLTIGKNSFCDSTIMLQSLLHSALKIGGWQKYIPTTIKIVLDKSDTAAINAFDTIAKNYNSMRGGPYKYGPSGFPMANGQTYAYYMKQSNSWMRNLYSTVQNLNPITELQAFAVNIYTSSYFTPMQDALRKTLSGNAIAPVPSTGTLQKWYGTGYTDLGNPNYQALIPLYAIASAGLLNIPAYHGTTFRGADTSWNPFAVGQGLRNTSYMSSADEFYGAGLPWPTTRYRDEWGRPVNLGTTPPPWNNKDHVRTQSLTARDISPYSMHQYEREHLYDYEFLEYVTSHETGGVAPPSGQPVQANLATIQVTDHIIPLLK